jgi:hypothetical protein
MWFGLTVPLISNLETSISKPPLSPTPEPLLWVMPQISMDGLTTLRVTAPLVMRYLMMLCSDLSRPRICHRYCFQTISVRLGHLLFAVTADDVSIRFVRMMSPQSSQVYLPLRP